MADDAEQVNMHTNEPSSDDCQYLLWWIDHKGTDHWIDSWTNYYGYIKQHASPKEVGLWEKSVVPDLMQNWNVSQIKFGENT